MQPIRVEREAQAVANWGLYEPNADGRHEDLDAFLHRPAELAQSLLDEGTTGMKIWPFDPHAEATQGHDISTAQLDRALAEHMERQFSCT